MDSEAELLAARLGRTVGERWRLERVLGSGGMAAVYLARDASGAIAAVKILHPEMGARREVRERFLREGYAANKIGHAGVVRALEHGDRENDVFLAMELLEGETLRDRVKRHGTLPLAEVLDFTEQILEVLVAAHEKGVVHRDLKPDNLFVTQQGRIKVLDFGLARLLDGVPGEHRTRTGVALGTLAYMAPEQALGRRAEIDGRVDLFALGATMFRILSGRRLHEAESEAELLMAMASRPAPPLASVAPALPQDVCRVVDLALAFSRDARYPDAKTMLADVRAVKNGQAPPYATARLAMRDEATRPDHGAPPVRTQPLGAKPESRPGTVPMPAYVPSVPAPMPAAWSANEGAPISVRPPSSTRTEPLQMMPGPQPNPLPASSVSPGPEPPTDPPFTHLAPVASPVSPVAVQVPVPAAATPGNERSSLGLGLVLGGLALVGTLGVLGVFLFARSQRDAQGVVPGTLPAVSEGARGAPATPAAPTSENHVAAPTAAGASSGGAADPAAKLGASAPNAAGTRLAPSNAGKAAATAAGTGTAAPATGEARGAVAPPSPPAAATATATTTASPAPAPTAGPAPSAPAPAAAAPAPVATAAAAPPAPSASSRRVPGRGRRGGEKHE